MKIFSFGILVFLCFTMACARAPQPPTEIPPTPAPIVYPATWTPLTTPLPPTSTPQPTPNGDTDAVMAAFQRTNGLTVYHAQMDVIVVDPSGSLPGSAPNKPLVVLSMDGRTNQTSQQMRLKGVFLESIGVDTRRGTEFIMTGQQLYVHGPMIFFGANENRWYVTPKTSGNDLSLAANPNGLLSEFFGTGAAMPTMRVTGHASLDGKECVVYHGDEQETVKLFLSLDLTGGLSQSLRQGGGSIQNGLLNVSVCQDGYVHQLELGVEIQPRTQMPKPVTIRFTIRLNDMNVSVPIPTPSDAVPLPKPFAFPTQSNPGPRLVPTPFRFPTFELQTPFYIATPFSF